jgi:transcriptional regulator with XRE-family HTH domain
MRKAKQTTIAKLIQDARDKAKLTRAQAAELCDVTWSQWWEWETGRIQPGADRLDMILGYLRVVTPKRRNPR